MKKEKSVIPVFFTIDDGYAPYASVAIASLIENASKDYCYKIHIVHQGLSEENKRKLSALADMFPEYEKGIYLDSDIVVPGDISELYQIELGEEFLIGACPDYSIQNIPELVRYLEQGIGVGRLESENKMFLLRLG